MPMEEKLINNLSIILKIERMDSGKCERIEVDLHQSHPI